jgi:hypothetical protein
MTFVSTLTRITTTLAAVAVLSSGAFAQSMHTTGRFSGAKVNAGTVTHTMKGAAHVLTLSPDFTVPDTPDPHWQVVDSTGAVHVLDRLAVKGDRVNTTLTLPAYVKDVAKVQIYCSWAEAVLGEATFSNTLKLTH